jgi:hypothetical protein
MLYYPPFFSHYTYTFFLSLPTYKMFKRSNYSPPPYFYVNTFSPTLCIFLLVDPSFVDWSERRWTYWTPQIC